MDERELVIDEVRNGMPKAKSRGKAAEKPDDQQMVIVGPVEMKTLVVPIIGVSPLIVNCWSEKVIQQLLDKHMKKPGKIGRDAKNPEEMFNASRYTSSEGWDGVPAGGVKGALVNACRLVEGLAMTMAKRMLFVIGQGLAEHGMELVRIHGEPKSRRDLVRIDNGRNVDIRFRAAYFPWSMTLEIQYLSNTISAEQVANLVQLTGCVEGLCEWRPGAPKSNTGSMGRFRLRTEADGPAPE